MFCLQVGFFHGSHGEDSLQADDDDLCHYINKYESKLEK